MKDSPEKISPLRRRMIEDMRMRKLAAQTQSGYIRAVRHFEPPRETRRLRGLSQAAIA
jgi:hypothetical protein